MRDTSIFPEIRPMNGWPSISTSTRSEPIPWIITPEPTGWPSSTSTPVRSVRTEARSVAPVWRISRFVISSVATGTSASR